MSCPACKLDYDNMSRQIAGGNHQVLDVLERMIHDLASSHLSSNGELLIICPECEETIARLKSRVASRLRKETLGNIHELLSTAYDERQRKEQQG